MNELILAIHRLASMHHLQAAPHAIQVVIRPEATSAHNLPEGVEVTDGATWEAQVKHGSGQWGLVGGPAHTPEDALRGLLAQYEAVHHNVDKRRADALSRAMNLR